MLLIYKALVGDQFFDDEHYHRVHVHEALRFVGKYGCRRLEVAKVLAPDRQRPNMPHQILRTTELWFDTYEALWACTYAPEMVALNPDHVYYHDNDTERAFMEATVVTFDENGDFASIDGPWSDYFRPMIGTVIGPSPYAQH